MRFECSDERLAVDANVQSARNDGHFSHYRCNNNQQMADVNITQNSAHRIWDETQHPHQCDDDTFYYVYEIGLYGVRRLILYSLLTVIIISVILNVILTIWITTIIKFDWEGIGKLKVHPEGVKYSGHAVISGDVYTKFIKEMDSGMRITSEKAILLNGRINENMSNRVNIEQRTIAVQSHGLLLRDVNDDVLLNVDKNDVKLTTGQLCLQNTNGLVINGSLQAASIKSAMVEELKMESLTRKVRLKCSKKLIIYSINGDIFTKSNKIFTISSKAQSISVQSPRIELKDLRTALPTRRGRTYPRIHQLCSCEDGKLFATKPDETCKYSANICGQRGSNNDI